MLIITPYLAYILLEQGDFFVQKDISTPLFPTSHPLVLRKTEAPHLMRDASCYII